MVRAVRSRTASTVLPQGRRRTSDLRITMSRIWVCHAVR
jgi:hypothetical protein